MIAAFNLSPPAAHTHTPLYYRQIAWIGCIDYKMDQSIAELAKLLDVTIDIGHQNKGRYAGDPNAHTDQDVVDRLKALVPYDTAVYEYAKQIVDVRTAEDGKGRCAPLPPRPSLPPEQTLCRMTKARFQCPASSAFGLVDYTIKHLGQLNLWTPPQDYLALQNELVPPL